MTSPSVCVESDFISLKEMCIRFCVQHPHVMCRYNKRTDGFELHEGFALPPPVSEEMVSILKQDLKGHYFGVFMKLFSNTQRTRLEVLDLSNSDLTDEILESLTGHPIIELNISGCKQLSSAALNSISKMKGLKSLIIGSSFQVFGINLCEKAGTLREGEDFFMRWPSLFQPSKAAEPPPSLILPLLKNLVIHDVLKLAQHLCFMSILDFSPCLTHLDLSNCKVPLDELRYFLASSVLVSLTLRDVPGVDCLVHWICEVKTLRKLDISNSGDYPMLYSSPDLTLEFIVNSLENLEHLDISGTNLAGESDGTVTDIPGLASRAGRPLKFLGLFNCTHDACFRTNIPALQVTGLATEEQMLCALRSYRANEKMMEKVFPHVFELTALFACSNKKQTLGLLIQAMEQHLQNGYIQIHGSACIFYILKAESKLLFDFKMKRRIIKLVIDVMYWHTNITILKNFCCLLGGFKVSDLCCEPEQLIIVLQRILVQNYKDEFLFNGAMSLLGSLSDQVNGEGRRFMRDIGLISCLLQIIRGRIFMSLIRGLPFDDVMRTAWKILLTITDGTDESCTSFILGEEFRLFLFCKKTFPEETLLLSNMLKLLGKMAAGKSCILQWIRSSCLSTLRELQNHEDVEVSKSAAEVLSVIAANGVSNLL